MRPATRTPAPSMRMRLDLACARRPSRSRWPCTASGRRSPRQAGDEAAAWLVMPAKEDEDRPRQCERQQYARCDNEEHRVSIGRFSSRCFIEASRRASRPCRAESSMAKMASAAMQSTMISPNVSNPRKSPNDVDDVGAAAARLRIGEVIVRDSGMVTGHHGEGKAAMPSPAIRRAAVPQLFATPVARRILAAG